MSAMPVKSAGFLYVEDQAHDDVEFGVTYNVHPNLVDFKLPV